MNSVCSVNTDGRGFDVRRKLSTVVPDDVTCGGAEKAMSSELFALVCTVCVRVTVHYLRALV